MRQQKMLNSVEVKILDDRLKQMMIGRATSGSAAIDLHACIEKQIIVDPGQDFSIGTGISIYIKNVNYCAFILPRSGLSSRFGIVLSNTTGLIDADYQGEIILKMRHQKANGYSVPINPLDRVAQIIFLPIARPEFNFVQEFSEESTRGQSGFGSTGK
jgi:dUTP pyrophosphatase